MIYSKIAFAFAFAFAALPMLALADGVRELNYSKN